MHDQALETVIEVNELRASDSNSYQETLKTFDSTYTHAVTFKIFRENDEHHGSSLTFSNKAGFFTPDEEVRIKNGKLNGNQGTTSYSEDNNIATHTSSVYENDKLISKNIVVIDFKNNNILKETISYGHVPWSMPNLQGLNITYDQKNSNSAEFRDKNNELDVQKTKKLQSKLKVIKLEDEFKYMFGIFDKAPAEERHKRQVLKAAQKIAPKA